MRSLSPAQLLVLNPLAHVTAGDGISVVVSDPAPFAPASVHAIAVDAGATRSVADSLLRSLRPGGRLLAPADFERPPDVSEIARDDEVWVGERQGSATPPIAIAKRGSG